MCCGFTSCKQRPSLGCVRSIPGLCLPLGSSTRTHRPGKCTLYHTYYPSPCTALSLSQQHCSPNSSVPPPLSAQWCSWPHPASDHCSDFLVAGWHWWQGSTGCILLAWCLSTFHSLLLPPARPQSMCHPPQKPAASPACSRGHPSRASGWPHCQECPSQWSHREAPSKSREWLSHWGWGILPPMPTHSSACRARQWKGGLTLLAHPLPLPISASPPICMVRGKARCNVWIVIVSSFSWSCSVVLIPVISRRIIPFHLVSARSCQRPVLLSKKEITEEYLSKWRKKLQKEMIRK